MNRFYGFLLLTCMYGSTIQSSSQPSTSTDRFKINYSGTLNGKDVDYINISGLTEKIIFYEKPAQQNKDPKTIAVEKDLSDIKSIMVAEGDAVAKYAGDYYVEIIVRDHVGNSRTLLVPQSKKVNVHEPDNSWVNYDFSSVQSLQINKASCNTKTKD